MAIPLPGPIGDTLGQGIDSGFSGVNQLLQPYFNRKMQQAQQQRMAEQFQKEQAMRQEQQQRLAQQFQQDFALRQQGEQRKGSLMPLQEQLLQQKINAQRPEYMAQQAKEFMNSFGGPEAMNNPIMRGLLKHKFGIDLDRESPEQKDKRALDLYKQKEEIKLGTNKGETLTGPIRTKYQSVIAGSTSARPIIKKLIEDAKKGNIPGQIFGKVLKADSQASYKGEISTLLDGIRNAYTIPNTDSGTEKAEDKVLRKPGESDENYIKRLKEIDAQIVSREKDARAKLGTGKITGRAESSSNDNDPLGIR